MPFLTLTDVSAESDFWAGYCQLSPIVCCNRFITVYLSCANQALGSVLSVDGIIISHPLQKINGVENAVSSDPDVV